IIAHPLSYFKVIVYSIRHHHTFYFKSLIGVLGWLTIYLPTTVYVFAASALLLSVLTEPADVPRLPGFAVVWNILLLIASVLLIFTSTYLIFEYVASSTIEGVQGRYFIPLLPLFIVILCSIVRLRASPKASCMAFGVVTLIVAAEISMADIAIAKAYQVF
ncbi:MAG TPA: DUF2142 domain-containing protein, partial [Xanthobacteraceae bacterium]